MKKIISFCAVMFLTVGVAMAQYPIQQSANAFHETAGRATNLWSVTNWSAFSADSAATVYTGMFPNQEYDSVVVWCYASSANGNAKFRGTLQATFPLVRGSSQTVSWDSVGSVADTANTRLDAMYKVGTIHPDGAAQFRVALIGSTVATGAYKANRKDVIVNLYLVCYKHVGNVQPVP